MRVLSVIGITKSGKTSTIEQIIAELRRRRYSVGSVKDIHFEQFAIDIDGTNTDRHKKAGSQLVTARGLFETDVLYPERLPAQKILEFYDHDFVVLEGVDDYNVPQIVTAHNEQEIDERLNGTVFALAGMISHQLTEYKKLPVFNALENISGLVDYIEQKVPVLLPNMPSECCSKCGMSCEEMLEAVLKGEKNRDDCLLNEDMVKLVVDGKEIPMVGFVEQVLSRTIRGLVSTLDGYKQHGVIELKLNPDAKKD